MAYTFFKSLGLPIGKSLVEDDKLDAARTIEADAAARKMTLALPVDHVVAERRVEALDLDWRRAFVQDVVRGRRHMWSFM
jgi:3-phosphoglycerate kinase